MFLGMETDDSKPFGAGGLPETASGICHRPLSVAPDLPFFRGIGKEKTAFFVAECFVRPSVFRRSEGKSRTEEGGYFPFFAALLRSIPDFGAVRSVPDTVPSGKNTLFSERNSSGGSRSGRGFPGMFRPVGAQEDDFSFVVQCVVYKIFVCLNGKYSKKKNRQNLQNR